MRVGQESGAQPSPSVAAPGPSGVQPYAHPRWVNTITALDRFWLWPDLAVALPRKRVGSSRRLHIRFTEFRSVGRARALQAKGLRAIHRLLFTHAMGRARAACGHAIAALWLPDGDRLAIGSGILQRGRCRFPGCGGGVRHSDPRGRGSERDVPGHGEGGVSRRNQHHCPRVASLPRCRPVGWGRSRPLVPHSNRVPVRGCAHRSPSTPRAGRWACVKRSPRARGRVQHSRKSA